MGASVAMPRHHSVRDFSRDVKCGADTPVRQNREAQSDKNVRPTRGIYRKEKGRPRSKRFSLRPFPLTGRPCIPALGRIQDLRWRSEPLLPQRLAVAVTK